ncbi:MAG: tetraacyldisaccharide 4'-kinase [Candidatus Rokubacteria bacterium]|nr:tetraacyldisaccharide 4'-kinase [Candidatus Rokubacteria bacterium]
MSTRRSQAQARLLHGWEHGFSSGPTAVMGVLGRGYRGLLGAREWLYRRGVLRSRPLGCPVVSVGNLTVGGTGKTPAVELAVRTLAELGRRPAVVSRGYRRRTSGVQIVADTASIRLDPEDAGDEPFLLARRLPGVPVVVGANRHEAGQAAVDRFGSTAIVLDDGFQHRTLAKDLEIVMTRARRPWGNGLMLPGGPLREPLSALARADLVVATGVSLVADAPEVLAATERWAPAVPVLAAGYAPVECWESDQRRLLPLEDLKGARLLAFAGLASPESFRSTLADLGADVAAFEAFVDHHWYTADDLAALERRARESRADMLITTEKDWVRLRRLGRIGRPIYVLSIRLELRSGLAEWRRAFERACRTA